MIIKNLKKDRINIDKRGKISTGIKAVNDRGIEYPKAVDYFVIDDFPELKQVYGDKPKKLVVVFPTNEIEDFFQASYVLYGSNQQMIRKCDGEECVHRIKERILLIGEYDELGNIHETEPYEKDFEAGEITECICKLMPKTISKDGKEVRNPKACNIAMYLKAFIVDYKISRIISPLCYLFYSGSENTASKIYSELNKVKMMMGRIAGLPFGLSVDMIPGKTNAKIKYPVWNLQVLGSMAQLEESAKSFVDYRKILTETSQRKLNQHNEPNNNNNPNENLDENPNENLDDDFDPEKEQNPDYWIDIINKITSLNELNKFEKEHYRDLTIFSGKDYEKIKDAFKSKFNSLSNSK